MFVEARLEKVEKIKENHFAVSVKVPAKRNLANARVMELMAEEFKIARRKVRLVSGHHSPSKIISIDTEV